MIPKYRHITVEMKVPIDHVIEFIRDDPSNYNKVEEDLQIKAVQRHSGCLEYMARPTKAVQEAAIASNPANIGRLRRPSREIQLLAVSLRPDVLDLIFNPCSEAKSLAAILD